MRLKRQSAVQQQPTTQAELVTPLSPDWQSWQLLDQIERQLGQQLDELRAIRLRLPPLKRQRTGRREYRVLVEEAVTFGNEMDAAPPSDWQTVLDYRVDTSGWRAALALASDFGYNSDDDPPGRVEHGGR